jgi:NTP pyrophosphatase (non-canonical NTP hydrolase)
MPMTNKGLSKLLEETGELTQIAAKKLAYIHTDEHPDGKGSLASRMEDELADVVAAGTFVTQKFELDTERMKRRSAIKLAVFQAWDAGDDAEASRLLAQPWD